MFGHRFYHQTTRRYVAIFGTLFNDISITRKNNSGVQQQIMKVPLNYGPMQKFLSRTQQDPEFRAPAITLPRMSFQLVSMTYDGERKLANSTMFTKRVPTSPNGISAQYTPAPYNLEFELNIMTKYEEDGSKILEQILPFFKPEFTVTAKLIDEMDTLTDIPIVLNNVSHEDTYEGSYEERRTLIWTLSFTLKGYFFGPISEKKIIKFVDINVYDDLTANSAVTSVTVQPGLTANGEPTTDITQTIPYTDIEFDDNWAYIVRIEHNE